MMEVYVRDVRLDAGKPKICVPIIGRTFDEIMEQASLAKKSADIIEWRADYYQDLQDDEELLITLLALRDELRNIPLIFNIRTKEAQGQIELPMQEYRRINEFVVTSRVVDICDIELSHIDSLGTTFIRWMQALDVKVILSDHNFEETPEAAVLLFRLNMMEHFGADIAKLTVQPNSQADVLRLMDTTLKAQTFVSLPIVSVSLGNLGKLSRVSGYLDGSCMTYGCLPGNESSPGQMEVETLKLFLDTFS